ncbi:hypothetical protein CONPUDRAFT_151527 [Coniophora puteana RWD-64-598 SS2]|uniref:Uncharacterized protein n=1 Tax=Coniophora puteana (strain RWD-64-598) TaxID=741705 RepID=A0A5M3N0U6_CONPW|nr:uncharacterized protein CONPUDRAFT_151527 [Coniophora puteana RWD-64-598 SS2]EIW84511.1 hypothetical protein CONPUDRAFT_151527 [Coniophora puteana RWD-64-598 SS2]
MHLPDNNNNPSYGAAIILSAVYGYQAHPVNDPLSAKLNAALEVAVQVSAPEKSLLVEYLPFVKYIPS